MNTLKVIIFSLFFSILMACGGGSDAGPEKQQGAIPKHQLKALNKADAMENTLLEAEQERKKRMEEQGL